MLARRDTRIEASRLRHLSPLQTLEDQSQTWGIRCHSCTGREELPPSWKLSYKTYVLRFTRESRFSFNQRIARPLMSYAPDLPPYKRWIMALDDAVCALHAVLEDPNVPPVLPRRFQARLN